MLITMYPYILTMYMDVHSIVGVASGSFSAFAELNWTFIQGLLLLNFNFTYTSHLHHGACRTASSYLNES